MGSGPGPPLDLRKLGYFVAVAEELHFGRAAERLYVAQSVLSRQIRKLELELGSDLLVRTSRNVALTPAGEQLLDNARPLLAEASSIRRRMNDLANGEATLTIGFFPGEELTSTLRTFGDRCPGVTINLLRVHWGNQTRVLIEGEADVAFVHLPVDDEGLELRLVRSEPRVAVLPVSHPAADRLEISIADLADDPVIIQRGASPGWQSFHNVDPRPDGRQPRTGPAVDDLEEKLQYVAAGLAVSFLPASTAAARGQGGIVYVPVTDIPPLKICLAWRSDSRSALVEEFLNS